jgi:hypothetical protein
LCSPREEIHELFVYLGAFPSHDNKADPLIRREYEQLLEVLPEGMRTQRHMNEQLTWLSSWTYQNCPTAILDSTARSLQSSQKPRQCDLALAGNCFNSTPHFTVFWKALDRAIQSSSLPPNDWLRAYRNLARFRSDSLSLKALNPSQQARILSWYLQAFDQSLRRKQPRIIANCCYLAPHLLKRRRFAPDFLSPESRDGETLEELLKRASKSKAARAAKKSGEAALEFLHRTADRNTLERLSAEEGA